MVFPLHQSLRKEPPAPFLSPPVSLVPPGVPNVSHVTLRVTFWLPIFRRRLSPKSLSGREGSEWVSGACRAPGLAPRRASLCFVLTPMDSCAHHLELCPPVPPNGQRADAHLSPGPCCHRCETVPRGHRYCPRWSPHSFLSPTIFPGSPIPVCTENIPRVPLASLWASCPCYSPSHGRQGPWAFSLPSHWPCPGLRSWLLSHMCLSSPLGGARPPYTVMATTAAHLR